MPGQGVDLATGTAGVLLALAMARHERPVSLPLLDSRPTGWVPTATEEGRR